MIEKELKILKENWKCSMSPQEDGEAPNLYRNVR